MIRLRTTDTRYFVDPSIAAAALGIGPGELMNDLTAFGLYFELRIASDHFGEELERDWEWCDVLVVPAASLLALPCQDLGIRVQGIMIKYAA